MMFVCMCVYIYIDIKRQIQGMKGQRGEASGADAGRPQHTNMNLRTTAIDFRQTETQPSSGPVIFSWLLPPKPKPPV